MLRDRVYDVVSRSINKTKNMKNLLIIIIYTLSYSFTFAQEKINQDFKAELEIDNTSFLKNGAYEGQHQNYISGSFKPEYSMDWNEGKQSFKAALFGRLDQYDKNRTHFDIREFFWQGVFSNHEVSVGIKEIYWGVAESNHLVNFINQTDVVESFDGEAKLGQPMVHYSYAHQLGIFDVIFMPYFRTITFPGEEGRLRTPIILDGDDFPFESKSGKYHPDIAVRWSNYIGIFDIGVAYFYGTNRQPLIKNIQEFAPFYGIVNQASLDLQATTGPVLWKFEGLYNSNSVKDFVALVSGFEYTFGNVGGNGLDIGIVGEYSYDGRDELALSSLQNDVFTGMRLAFNDFNSTEILAGGIFDLERSTQLYSVEASRRFRESYKVEIEGRFFNNVDTSEFVYFVRNDSYIKLGLSKFF